LQAVQRPSEQAHEGTSTTIRLGPQPMSQVAAAGSLRSVPPGQHRRTSSWSAPSLPCRRAADRISSATTAGSQSIQQWDTRMAGR
jgi:hypothetical protein